MDSNPGDDNAASSMRILSNCLLDPADGRKVVDDALLTLDLNRLKREQRVNRDIPKHIEDVERIFVVSAEKRLEDNKALLLRCISQNYSSLKGDVVKIAEEVFDDKANRVTDDVRNLWFRDAKEAIELSGDDITHPEFVGQGQVRLDQRMSSARRWVSLSLAGDIASLIRTRTLEEATLQSARASTDAAKEAREATRIGIRNSKLTLAFVIVTAFGSMGALASGIHDWLSHTSTLQITTCLPSSAKP